MSTLSENVTQAIEDFDDIRDAIEEQDVEVPEGTPTSQYGDKVRQIQGHGSDNRAFITVQSLQERDELPPEFLVDGKIVCVNHGIGGNKSYYSYYAIESSWVEWQAPVDLTTKQNIAVYSSEYRPPFVADKPDYFETGDVWTYRGDDRMVAYICISPGTASPYVYEGTPLYRYVWQPAYNMGFHNLQNEPPEESEVVVRRDYSPQGASSKSINIGADEPPYFEGDFLYTGDQNQKFIYIDCLLQLSLHYTGFNENTKWKYKWAKLPTTEVVYTKQEVNTAIENSQNLAIISVTQDEQDITRYFTDLCAREIYELCSSGKHVIARFTGQVDPVQQPTTSVVDWEISQLSHTSTSNVLLIKGPEGDLRQIYSNQDVPVEFTWDPYGGVYYYSKAETNTLLAQKEALSNKVITINQDSTDDQYPTAKCMFDIIGDIESLLSQV